MVADEGVQVGYDTDGVQHVVHADFRVGGDPFHALLAQGDTGFFHQAQGFEHGLTDHRLHDVQLQLTGFGGEGDGDVVTEYLEAGLVDHFRNNRVDLGWHDGRAGLHFRQVDLFQCSAWAGGEQTQVITDLGHFHGQALDGAVQHDVGTTV